MKNKIKLNVLFFATLFFIGFFAMKANVSVAASLPVLNFSDITSGPKDGNTDGLGSGAIVTLWGNNLGSTQEDSKVYVGDVEATQIYYWKNADGELPGGPSDLSTYHKMQEVAFSVPYNAIDGLNTIKVTVGGVDSNTLPFTVRTGNIKFVKSGGTDNTECGDWSTPCASLQYMANGNNSKVVNGDIVYSVGVGVSAGLGIGAVAYVDGTEARPISVIAYPNSQPLLTGTYLSTGATIISAGHGDLDRCDYWNFSKLDINTDKTGMYGIFGTRFIGDAITGPTVPVTGMAGAIGGSGYSAGGGKFLGVNIHNYGDGVDVPASRTQHLFYLSNRRTWIGEEATANVGYEIGWGNFIDNDIYQGIHVYDVSGEGGWNTPILIHDNVVKNQWGNSIDIDIPSTLITQTNIYIYNNIVITDPDYALAGAPMRINASQHNVYIYNNTTYGYNSTTQLDSGYITFRNNILVDLENKPFVNYAPTTHSNNLFYSTGTTVQPTWAPGEAGHVTGNPLFRDMIGYDFSLQATSPVIDAGATVSSVPKDFLGLSRPQGVSYDIGALEYDPSEFDTTSPNSPSGLIVY